MSSLRMILVGMLASGALAAYWYYITTQAELEKLRVEVELYEVKFATQTETIDELKSEVAAQTERLNNLAVANQEAEVELNRYLDIFRRHNLQRLARAKPDWMTNIVNNGTKDVFDSIEETSRVIDGIDGDELQLAPTENGDTNSDETSQSSDSTTDTTSGN